MDPDAQSKPNADGSVDNGLFPNQQPCNTLSTNTAPGDADGKC